jgi:hypothetical protein
MKLFLIYVNYIGKDYRDNYIYEFIFSTTTQDIDGDEWDTYPASGRPSPPHESFISRVGRLESDLKLDTVQHSDTFAVWDAIDGVIALAWENVDDYDTYPDKRICFKFGDTLKDVETLLYEKDLILKYNEQEHEYKK